MPLDALNRLETLALMSKVELPLHALRAQITSAIDVIVQVTRFSDGRRGLTQVSEVLPLGDDGKYRVQDMYTYQLGLDETGTREEGQLRWTETRSQYAREPKVRILRDHIDLTKHVFASDE
jgi:pilus assembly protein CpaF